MAHTMPDCGSRPHKAVPGTKKLANNPTNKKAKVCERGRVRRSAC
jgi:hypothetical protein